MTGDNLNVEVELCYVSWRSRVRASVERLYISV